MIRELYVTDVESVSESTQWDLAKPGTTYWERDGLKGVVRNFAYECPCECYARLQVKIQAAAVKKYV